MECPIHGCKHPVTKSVKETIPDLGGIIKDATLIDENETYEHYSSGVLVHKKYSGSFLKLPEEIPLAPFPTPPYPITKS